MTSLRVIPARAASLAQPAPNGGRVSLRTRALLTLALFAIIWGAKVTAIERFGSDLPYWDQWAKEGELTFVPALDRGELWTPLFTPHNEHRIVPTLALNLGLVVIGGQWDARVQCIVSAGLHAALAAALLWWAVGVFAARWVVACGVLLALVVGAPVAWENVLGGFQSQFYFLLGFSLLAIAGLLGTPAGSWRWWIGISASALAMISMGSGLLAPAVVVAITLFRLWKREGARRETLATLSAAILLLAAGWLLRPRAPWHATLHAHTLSDFLLYAVHSLAWPLPKFSALAAVAWLPWLALVVMRVRRSEKLTAPRAADLVIAVGAWTLLQTAAVAYSRGGGGGFPAPRYGDVLAFGPLVSFAALALLRPAWSGATKAAAAFLVIIALSVGFATREAWTHDLATRKAETTAFEASVRAFVATDDYATFEHAKLPFPIADWLARILRMPTIRRILPVSVRTPIALPELGNSTPPAPPLPHARARTLRAGEHWESPPVAPTHGWWKVEVAGYPESAGVTLQPVDTQGGEALALITPTKTPGDAWRAAYVRAPDTPARFVAHVSASDRWLAFSEPTEMSTLSYLTFRFAKEGRWLLLAGCVAFFAGGFAVLREERNLTARPLS